MTTNLIDDIRQRLRQALPPLLAVLTASMNVLRLRARAQSSPVDPLAEWCAEEALCLLQEHPPQLFEGYLCLEVAAAREPAMYGSSFRGYRERMMRAVLGAAREKGLMANVADTTSQGRWVARYNPRCRAQLRGYELRVFLDDGRIIVFDRDLGMEEGFDA